MFGGQRKVGELRQDVVRVAAATSRAGLDGAAPATGVEPTDAAGGKRGDGVCVEEAVNPTAKRARRRLRGLAPEAAGKGDVSWAKAPHSATMKQRLLPFQSV